MVSFNIQSIVHYEFVLQGQTVNQHYHIDTLQHLLESMQQNRPEEWSLGIGFFTMTTHLLTLLLNF
jgi:hypothetical protein